MSDNQSVKVYFLGSGRLGTAVLTALSQDSRVELCGIGSQPDRPVGRKKTITPTVFASHALAMGYEVDRLESVNSEEFLEKLRSLGVEILLVVAFGQLLKAPLLALPMFGCLNVHASLLPKYRGACPINAAILNGDRETGVAFMAMNKGLDTGPVYQIERLEISPEENAEELEARLGQLAAAHIGEVCWKVAREGLQATPQPETKEPNVRKISKSDGLVDWQDSAERLARKVRAYFPWPKVFTAVPGPNGTRRNLQIVRAEAVSAGTLSGVPGTILPGEAGSLRVACGDGVLVIHRVVPEGKREMDADAFLRGNPLAAGTVLP